MRLPWPFGRSQAAPAETEPKTDAGGSAPEQAAPLAAAATAATAPPTGAWTRLPPIQRVIGEPPLVAPATAFLGDVPGANQLPPIVGQLGHDVTPLAPAGLVAAPVHPVAALTSHASLVDRPVQRRADATATAAEPAAWAPAEPASADAAGVASPTPQTTAEPVRHLSVVPGDAAAAPPARSLTRADVWAPPAHADRPLVHRTNVQASSARSTGASTGTASEPAAQPAPHAAPDAGRPVADPPLQLTSGGAQPASPPASTPRRPGLGAPLASAPPTAAKRSPASAAPTGRPLPGPIGPAAVQRIGGLAGSSPPYSTIQRRGPARSVTLDGETAGPSPTSFGWPGSPGAPYVGSPGSGRLPSLPVVNRQGPAPDARPGEPADAPRVAPAAGSPREPSPAPAAATPVGGPDATSMPFVARATAGSRADLAAALQRTPAAASPGTSAASGASATPSSSARRPLIGARPLRPSIAPNAAPAEVPTTSPDIAPPLPVPTLPSVQPAGAASPDVVIGQTWTHPAAAVDPALQRALEQSAPRPGPTALVQRLTGRGPAAPAPSHSDRRDAPAMTLARFAGPVAGSTSGSGSAGQAAMVLPAGSAGPSPGIVGAPPSVQASTAATLAAPALAPTATAVVQREDAAAPPAPAEGQGPGRSEGDLEELARALFPRFQRQLRMEYVYEREARGLPFDS